MKLLIICVLLCSFVCGDLADWLGLDDENSFRCVHSRKLIPKEYLNDNFCDCWQDGSDELLTNACPNGKFTCDSVHPELEKTIFSSHVKDGICDCCDGTDEEHGVCEDLCTDKIKEFNKDKEESMRTFNEGSAIRKEWIVKGLEGKASRSGRLAAVDAEYEALKVKRDELEATQAAEEALEEAEKEEMIVENTNKFKSALKLEEQSGDTLRELVAFVGSKNEKSSEKMIECMNPFASDVIDDVSVLSVALEIGQGFQYTELYDEREKLRVEEEKQRKYKKSEEELTDKRDKLENDAEEGKTQEASPQKGGKKDLSAVLKNLKDKRDKPAEPAEPPKRRKMSDMAFDLDDDDYDYEKFNRHSKGVIKPSGDYDSLTTLSEVEAELEIVQEKHDAAAGVTRALKDHVKYLEKQQKELTNAWLEKKRKDYLVAFGDDTLDDEQGMRHCVWEVALEQKMTKKLLDRLVYHYHVEVTNMADLTPPGERLDHTRLEAQRAKNDLRDVEKQKRDKELEKKDLEEESSFDFGAEEEFFVLLNECYSTRVDKYEYKFCPFRETKQDHTVLGKYDEKSWAAGDKSEMHFTWGQRCGDKDRSAVVYFECGAEPVLSRVAEPERCEYTMTFHNPASCT